MSDDPFPQQLPTLQRLGVDEPTLTSPTEVAEVATTWFNAFSSAVASSDIAAILDLFLEDGFWKDTLAFTWDFRTIEGREAIRNLLDHRLAPTGFINLRLCHEPFLAPQLLKFFPDLVLLRLSFEFDTKVGRGAAVCHLVPVPGSRWKAYSLYTCLQSLNDYPEQIGPLRQLAAEHGTWEERRRREVELADGDPTVLVIGAGHNGLEVAARLKYLGVSYLVIEKKARVGDNWRDRYKALALHTPVWQSQTAYLPFPPTWPVYSPARKLANWLESYAEYLELNVWTSSVITKTEWNDNLKTWTVEINRGGKDTRTFKVKHLVFATGFGGRPILPDIPGKEDFKGEILHSSEFTSAAHYIGKKAVVVGTGTSGHDIAQDFFNHGVGVTICQRSSTHIMSVEAIRELFGVLFNDTIPTDIADVYHTSLPYPLVKRIRQRIVPHSAQTTDKEVLDGLAKVGFKTNLGPYGAGLVHLLYSKGGGYYVDAGTTKHVINGDIKLKSGSAIERFTEKGVMFADGTELEVDVVVFATGYGDQRDSMRELCGPQVADKVNKVWGLTKEGDVNSIFRDSGHEGLWFAVGALSHTNLACSFTFLTSPCRQKVISRWRVSTAAILRSRLKPAS
ncbi:FAD/NAD(P)-binding domain-containing protein [Boletus reticuloceps]|uniref:FAD/NAD(P)-binding domain-containing protein n=1 Tax=Boletus reticuloceps TaxID=495285 RepID=A0A8I2YGR2_9AGAM|nr:FAD/NAD(P)-binding domain-containing protein [Boletus reticuloceps]